MTMETTSQTGIRATAPALPTPPAPDGEAPRERPTIKKGSLLYRLVAPIASLRLTVVLFSLSLVLVFLGTVAMKQQGLWTVVETYFRSLIVWIPFRVLFFFTADVPGAFPFPGGWLLGGLLLTNLIAAHALRFKFTWKDLILLPAFGVGYALLLSWESDPENTLVLVGACVAMTLFMAALFPLHGKRGGVILIHLGLVVMMVSEFITGLYAVEARMFIAEGQATNYVDVSREVELALVTAADDRTDDTAVVPGHLLRTGAVIADPALPVEVVVKNYWTNSDLVSAADNEESRKKGWPLGLDGRRYGVRDRVEEAGVSSKGRDDVPAALVALQRKDDGKEVGEFLVSIWFDSNSTTRKLQFVPHTFEAGGKTYTVELRPRRIYKPFAVQLIDFQHKKYLGTNRPKDFTSIVRLTDPSRNEDRKIRISMNEPLRYGGETFYQSAYFEDDSGTVLQVVRNPGWLMPYISCAMVTLGMLVHFGIVLANFLRKRLVVS